MSPTLVRSRHHIVIHGGFIFLATATQILTNIVWNWSSDKSVPNGLFQTSSWNVTETFPLDITMDWWSHLYWIIVNIWSTVWLLYAVVSLFNRNALGPESCNPELHPPVFYMMWTVVGFTKIFSMFLWDRHYIIAAAILGWILPVLSFSMLYISYSNLDKHKVWLSINNHSVIPWTRYLFQNGLAAFSWWSLLNAVMGFGVLFKYRAGVQDPLISTIVLTIIALCVAIWFILQNFILKKYLRYTFSVYATVILSLAAMFTRSFRYHELSANTIYCGCLMALMAIFNIIHSITQCLQTDESSKHLTLETHMTSVQTVWQPEEKEQQQAPTVKTEGGLPAIKL